MDRTAAILKIEKWRYLQNRRSWPILVKLCKMAHINLPQFNACSNIQILTIQDDGQLSF